MRKFEDSLPLQLLRARDNVLNFFRPMLQEHDITEHQWRILRLLNEHRYLEPKQISEKCCILAPSLTGILTRLEANGFIARQKSEQDQRRILICLTPKAKKLVIELSPKVDAKYDEIYEHYSPELIDKLSDLLGEINNHKQ
ncbi:homoprotocatechuate degradation operon regulator HpaR [Photobacterium sanctipauli]|uniref:Homoprotocatechuate degradation operon regulator HpaR n=1 Tax=Photobacterium sanctipauli TaxID=1342794 RepID=A0A2T3NMZ2_9GAMM|nr:homoprotocatechuate degradation operon regulator HpaR [Photobacterium sanctipauli]PSW16852.1 homoprotocatechuate degradation operon regulator HpaR [Photobacterium sanctipauli]